MSPPIGLALVATGILYFMICGRFLLPKNKMESASAQSMKDYMKRVYGIKADICEVRIPEGNLLIGEAIGDIMEAHHIYVIGYYHRGSKIFPPVFNPALLRHRVGWLFWVGVKLSPKWWRITDWNCCQG